MKFESAEARKNKTRKNQKIKISQGGGNNIEMRSRLRRKYRNEGNKGSLKVQKRRDSEQGDMVIREKRN